MRIILCVFLTLIPFQLYAVFEGEYPKKDWTFLLYYDGDNNLGRIFSEAIDQLRVNYSNESVHVVVQSDGPFPGDSKRRYFSKDGDNKEIIFEDGLEYDMEKEETLAEFVRWGLRMFPSKRVILSINGHGIGALSLPLLYGSEGKYFDTIRLVSLLKSVLGEKKIDLLIHSACLMGSFEILSEFSKIANYAVASEDIIFIRRGMIYHGNDTAEGVGISNHLLPAFLNKNSEVKTAEVASFLVDEFDKSYRNFTYEDELAKKDKYQYTLAAYNLGNLNKVAIMYEEVVSEMIEAAKVDQSVYNKFYREFFSLSKISVLGYLDFGLVGKVFYKVLGSDRAYAFLEYIYGNEFIINKSITNNTHSIAGVSISFPYDFYLVYYDIFKKAMQSYQLYSWVENSKHLTFSKEFLAYILEHKVFILSDMIVEYLKTGMIPVFRFDYDNLNEIHLFTAFEAALFFYQGDERKKFIAYHYSKIMDYNVTTARSIKHKEYILHLLGQEEAQSIDMVR